MYTKIWYLVAYGILCHYGNFVDDVSYEYWTNIVMDDGWVHPLTKPFLVNNLWWNIVMDDWNLDEKPMSLSVGNCNTINHKTPKFYKEWERILG